MDLETLRGIAEIMKDTGLTSLKLEEGDLKLKLERATQVTPIATPGSACGSAELVNLAPAPANPQAATPAGEAPASTVPTTPKPAALATADGTPCDTSRVSEVAAPMVGVFYVAPAPGAEPFVRVGAKVKKGDTLCILEAMKLMNEVTAERDGEVVEVCCEDGELVEYGRTLFRIY